MKQRTAAIVAVAGGLAIAIGSFLPWATLSAGILSRSVTGMEGDGVITIVLGGIAALIGLVYLDRPIPNLPRAGLLLIAIVCGAVAVIDYQGVTGELANPDAVNVSIGPGLFLIGFGAVALLAASFAGRKDAPA